MHSWGKFRTRYKKPKTQLPLLKSLEQKQAKGAGGPPKPPLQPDPEHTLTLTPYKEPAPPIPPTSGSKQAREPVVCSCSLCCSRGPNKVSPESLVWPLIHFYCWEGGQASYWVAERGSRNLPSKDSPARICLAIPETRFPPHIGELRFHMLQSLSAITGEHRHCNC